MPRRSMDMDVILIKVRVRFMSRVQALRTRTVSLAMLSPYPTAFQCWPKLHFRKRPCCLLMDMYVDLCCSFGLPVWIASLLHAVKRLRNDRARRKKVYRLLQRKLMFHRVGVKEGNRCQPTYVYPEEVKMLMHSVFSQDVCDYPNPCHDQVVFVTVEDLHKIN